ADNTTLLSLLALVPEALREAIARPGFVAALARPEFQSQVAELRKKQQKKKGKGWTTELTQLVEKESGTP
ncbi:hypothetical protein NGM37_13865, partial [Streptomyces sp. TRM76130]|nr:hypothetical protein [Streptomyces sp. TRM76130]